MQIGQGEVRALIGANGAGKSTLVKLLAGDIAPDDGQIIVGGEPVAFGSPHDALAVGIAAIHQDLAVAPDLTVAENIALGHETSIRYVPGSVSRLEAERVAQAILSHLGASIPVSTEVGSLSFAERQTVAIGRALARERRILILDEPTAALTEDSAEHLHGIVRALRDTGHAVLYVSHRLDEVLAIADSITVLRDGRLVTTRSADGTSTRELVQLMLGDARETQVTPSGRSDDTLPVLEVRRLSHLNAFSDVSFSVNAGEILGLAGIPGSGRDQVIGALVGAERLVGGEIFISGKARKIRSPRDAYDQGIALLPADRDQNGLLGDQSLLMNLLLPPTASAAWHGIRRRRAEYGLSYRLLSDVGVTPLDPRRQARQLSGGNQQRLMIGRALHVRPKVLLVEEPTQGVDVGGKLAIHELLKRFALEGAAVLMASSEFEELEAMCDRILVIASGQAVGWVRPSEYGRGLLYELALPPSRAGESLVSG
jgi:ABC-type sugar transport system ATPase subunit